MTTNYPLEVIGYKFEASHIRINIKGAASDEAIQEHAKTILQMEEVLQRFSVKTCERIRFLKMEVIRSVKSLTQVVLHLKKELVAPLHEIEPTVIVYDQPGGIDRVQAAKIAANHATVHNLPVVVLEYFGENGKGTVRVVNTNLCKKGYNPGNPKVFDRYIGKCLVCKN